MKNCVNVVLGKDEITLKINKQATEFQIEECLEEKIPELKRKEATYRCFCLKVWIFIQKTLFSVMVCC